MKKYIYLFLEIFLSLISLAVAASLITTSSLTMNLQNHGMLGVAASMISIVLPFFFFLPLRRLVPGHTLSEKVVIFGLITTIINTSIILRSNYMITHHPLAVLSQKNVQCHGAYSPVTRILGADRLSQGFIKHHFPTLSFLHTEYQDTCRVFKVKHWVGLGHPRLCFNQDKKLCLYKVFTHLNDESSLSTSGHILYTAITSLEVFKEKKRREEISSHSDNKKQQQLRISLDSGIDLMGATNYIKTSLLKTPSPYNTLKIHGDQKTKIMKLISNFSSHKGDYIKQSVSIWNRLVDEIPELSKDQLRLALIYSLEKKVREGFFETSEIKMKSLKRNINIKLDLALQKKELTIEEYANYKSRLKAIENNLSYTSSL